MGIYKTPKYDRVDVTDYLANPQEYAEREAMTGSECLPVGTYGGFVGMKGDPNIMEKTQYNLRDRFGFLASEDDVTSEDFNNANKSLLDY